MLRKVLIAAVALCAVGSFSANATTVAVANSSFEAPEVPATAPALPFMDAWQQTPKPDWYVEAPPENTWANLKGVFPIPPAGNQGHIDKADQKQAAFLFSVPSNGIYQDLPARYEVAQGYTLTVGLVSSSAIPLTEGTSLALSLYYRTSGNEMVTLASVPVVYNPANFPTNTEFFDFSVTIPPVKTLDAWRDKNIGVMIVSTSDPDKAGGVWDLENVRVEALPMTQPSFEAPEVPPTAPALPYFVGWQHTPKPDWYVEAPPENVWMNLAGVFPNPASGSPGHIANTDQKQGAFLFSVPSNGIFQELASTYEQGVSYQLTVGLVGSISLPPTDGTTLQIAFYYLDGTNQVTVASTNVTYNAANFPSFERFIDFSVKTPFVQRTEALAGKNIGVSIISSTAPEKAGGVWDVENVRLTADVLTIQGTWVGTNLRLTWPTRAGYSHRLQSSPDFTNWTSLGTETPGTGAPASLDVPPAAGNSFFRVRFEPMVGIAGGGSQTQ